jgi:hypothetical protein
MTEKASSLLLFLFIVSESLAQIPSTGADFPFLNKLRWDLSREEVQRIFADVETIKSGDTTVVYRLNLFGKNAAAMMQFRKESKRLNAVMISFVDKDPSLSQSIETHLTTRYGKPDTTNTKEEKRFLLGTIKAETMGWKLEEEKVVLFRAFRNNELMSVTILYVLGRKPTGQ